MAWGTVTIRVRPIRIAFLVDPADHAGLYRAIELSTFSWGGNYNPIIPAYRRTPAKWESHRVRRLPSPADIVAGYLDGFDPDLVVPVGKCASRSYEYGNRDLVRADDLIGELSDTPTPRHGVGLIELLKDFVEKELQYIKKRQPPCRVPCSTSCLPPFSGKRIWSGAAGRSADYRQTFCRRSWYDQGQANIRKPLRDDGMSYGDCPSVGLRTGVKQLTYPCGGPADRLGSLAGFSFHIGVIADDICYPLWHNGYSNVGGRDVAR